MPKNVRSLRWPQMAAWAVASLFVLGFFFPPLGEWTGAVLGAWFVGTQKPWRGLLWLAGFAFLSSLVANWRRFPLAGPERAFEYMGWMLLIALLGAAPFLFHRLVSPHLPGFLSTLPLPLSGAALESLALAWLPAGIFSLGSLTQSQRANTPLLHVGALLGIGAMAFLIDWFGAVVSWMWTQEFRASKIAAGGGLFAAVYTLAAGYGLFRHTGGATVSTGAGFAWICLGASLALGVWAFFRRANNRKTWAGRPQTVAILQSPYTGSPLQLAVEGHREVLVSPSGGRFPIRDGLPIFLKPDDLTGSNRKYNHLYETIGGFYDDTQRVWCGLSGMDQDAHFLSYLRLLEIKPGDSVLETSVGTGLNFKYLPRGVQLCGLDLSAEMLARCQANLRRWELDGDLFLGNAERLPFADSVFDVVFHVGGINFFNDRAGAIREMIRVAKPGRLILIADETEKHVESVYESMPVASGYFKNRQEAVSAPIDLVPPEMLEVHLETLLEGQFYVLTFRKPAYGQRSS